MEKFAYVNEGNTGTFPSLTTPKEPGVYPKQITTINDTKKDDKKSPEDGTGREKWGNDIEFLMSCISLSVGLGNIWRFPFTALENGGGAFLIPYLIVLFLVGKPVYYLEMIMGQFSSRGSVKVFDFAPITRGIGYGQVFANTAAMTYFASLMAITLRYFVDSFQSTLPWSYCHSDWPSNCIDSKLRGNVSIPSDGVQRFTSAEYYLQKIILREKDSFEDGIGYPSWSLALLLGFSWIFVIFIMIKGVKSSGKASYFLALFPYFVIFFLLIRSLTLPGAINGVKFFLTPQWDKLLTPKVWYDAVTQVFFSLAICFGNIIMLASYNRFGSKIQRDTIIITYLDMFTSLIAGVTMFGILGNLAYEKGTTDIQSVVKGGPGLAFISYPDAIAKFTFMPQIYSILFFLMVFTIGIGACIGQVSCIMTAIKDNYPNAKNWMIVILTALFGFFSGLFYITPGGQYLLALIDNHGAIFVVLVTAVFELLAVGWIYGVKQVCKDAEFMLGLKTSVYYRVCWGIVTPVTMAAILLYTIVSYQPMTYKGIRYTDGLYIFAWCCSALGIFQLIFWAIRAVCQQPGKSIREKICQAFKPVSDWGPLDKKLLAEYKIFLTDVTAVKPIGFWNKFYDNIFG